MELLAYLVSSAAGLREEPKIYGPLRLIEAAERLCRLAADDPATSEERRAGLRELAELIDSRKNDCMTDEESFYSMLDEASMRLVDCL